MPDTYNIEVPPQLREIIVSHLGVDDDEVTPDASFLDDLGADSLDSIELAISIEEAYSIELDDEEVEKARTVRDLIFLIQEKVGK